jgi:hypothetical protein
VYLLIRVTKWQQELPRNLSTTPDIPNRKFDHLFWQQSYDAQMVTYYKIE